MSNTRGDSTTVTIVSGSGGSTLYGSTPIYLGSGYGYGISTPSGVEAELKIKENTKKEISASLYLKFVKSKLTKVKAEKVKRRLAKLQKLVAYSQSVGQQALYEELTKEVAILVRESEMLAFNIDKWVFQKDIDKFRFMVKEKVIKWETLEKFPRVIPANVQRKLKALQKVGIFDEYHILFIDYTDQKLNTNKEKIRQKDPILFGHLKYQPDRFYYIADWVDEYCDLTLDKMVDKIKLEDPEFALSEIEDLDQARWDGIVQEVKDRMNRLSNTNSGNFRQLMSEEDRLREQKVRDEENAKRLTEEAQVREMSKGIAPKPKPFWKFW